MEDTSRDNKNCDPGNESSPGTVGRPNEHTDKPDAGTKDTNNAKYHSYNPIGALWKWLKRHWKDAPRETANVVFTGVIASATIVYAFVSGWQLYEIHKTNNVSIEAQSPLIFVYDISLIDHVPKHPPEKAIQYEDRIHLRLATDKVDGYVVAEFENFGSRAAIVQGIDIEWRVLDKLPAIPKYSHPRVYGDAIRPSYVSGNTPIPEPITDNHYPIKLSKEQAEQIRSHQTRLWIYGKVNLSIFYGRFQEIKFCDAWHSEPEDDPPEGFSSRDCPESYIDQKITDKRTLILKDWYQTTDQK